MTRMALALKPAAGIGLSSASLRNTATAGVPSTTSSAWYLPASTLRPPFLPLAASWANAAGAAMRAAASVSEAKRIRFMIDLLG
jgi:hypothetical protein